MLAPETATTEDTATTERPEPHRLLLVHAHPDDEVTTTGVTMARAVADGAQVTLVTCTLGEEGEIVVDDLKYLGADRDGGLGEYRIGELNAALGALGVTDSLRLGHDGKYRDSGMATDDQGRVVPVDLVHDEAFWRADLREAATDLVPVIRDRRPEVLITYDDYGNYGHPDHIQAHRVAMYAAQLAAIPAYRPDLGEAWQVRRILWTTMSESWMREGLRQMRAAGDTESWGGMDPEGPMPPMVRPDDQIALTVSAPELVDRKLDAFRAHRTQISFDSPFFQMAETYPQAWANEWFVHAGGEALPAGATDIFAGLRDE
ncbi:N-acetyl-1-D-myo-inositol-2-amino-2-deoxy-alpha-D-glucopyranoside deacetylase [Enemella evansiae]|uniref:N-acetyl-1-D-myo-inositol-2-amino-2-deoxy-alpha- D-glucopyranoside deacetylase n=1 Tax=Enemella evansiae TaxID=2016499 RepID=UPI001E3DFD60|nr:N-acetyl-1-D-myo-inositol-2-amino-2-deoxy-alpha-D-glucopyranoside deacetylase [Enemella evansiae]